MMEKIPYVKTWGLNRGEGICLKGLYFWELTVSATLHTFMTVQIILTIWSSFNCYEVLHVIILVSVYSLYMHSGQTLELQDSRKEKEKEVTCMVTGQKLA